MKIHFYLPEKYLPEPETAQNWELEKPFKLHESGKIAAAQCWIWQTWCVLKKADLNVHLTHTLPDSGVVISLAGFLGKKHRPSTNVFFVAVAADWTPHPLADWHLVQNGRQQQLVPCSTYIPNWTQPNLIRRNISRKPIVENAAFYGDPANLAAEMKSWPFRRELSNLGINFEIYHADRWHDYSKVDVAIGIRSFNKARYHHKPPTKLFNAWLAGVPFIGGNDSAYEFERKNPLDFLKATSQTGLVVCLRRLKSDPNLWEKMSENGLRRAHEVSRSAIAKRWVEFITAELPSAHAVWRFESEKKRCARLLIQRARLALLERLIRFIS